MLSWRRRQPQVQVQARPESYEGPLYKCASNWWFPHVALRKTEPLRYLEIGVFYGNHLFEVAALLPTAELHGVDPWLDYDEYSEYKNTQSVIFNGFQSNLSKCPDNGRIQVHRGFSDEVVPQFANEYFDVVYVDGNHATEYVYRDGCMAFQKLKSEGYIVFDDYDWKETCVGINQFIDEYKDKLKIIGGLGLTTNGNYFQMIVQKL